MKHLPRFASILAAFMIAAVLAFGNELTPTPDPGGGGGTYGCASDSEPCTGSDVEIGNGCSSVMGGCCSYTTYQRKCFAASKMNWTDREYNYGEDCVNTKPNACGLFAVDPNPGQNPVSG